MKIKTAALLSTAVIGLAITLGQTLNAQEADNMNDVVPTVGESVSNAGKAVANNVKDSAAKATNAAKGAINSVVGSIPAAQEPEEKEKPGDNAPTIMPPDFELSGVVGQASKIG